ncbi:MAG: universal stress protein [Candidatus Kapaibacterium sp.]
MYKFNNILVPTDFSEQFRIAMNYAKELAASVDSTLHILHVIEPAIMPGDAVFSPHAKFVDVEKNIRENAEKNLAELKDELEGEKIKVKTELVYGQPSEKIIDYAKNNKLDLICIATHGVSGFEHFLFGSTTEKVLRKAPCPVIAVRMPEYE